MANEDDKRTAEAWMVDRYGPQLGPLSSTMESYAVRRHVRDAYAAGLADGRARALAGVFPRTLGSVK
jgi:hypothetical protein